MDEEYLRQYLRKCQSLDFKKILGPKLEKESWREYEIRNICVDLKTDCFFLFPESSVIDYKLYFQSIDKKLEKLSLILNPFKQQV